MHCFIWCTNVCLFSQLQQNHLKKYFLPLKAQQKMNIPYHIVYIFLYKVFQSSLTFYKKVFKDILR